jgi:hypothetical protein
VEWTEDVEDWEKVRALAPFHLWQESEIEKRYRQDDQPRVSVAFVRISRLSEPFVFPDSPRYGGCRSWIEVPDLPESISLSPVLPEEVHKDHEKSLRKLLATG